MKVHTRKKQYRAWLKALAKKGYANNSRGQMVQRSDLPDNQMRSDYYPQRSA